MDWHLIFIAIKSVFGHMLSIKRKFYHFQGYPIFKWQQKRPIGWLNKSSWDFGQEKKSQTPIPRDNQLILAAIQ